MHIIIFILFSDAYREYSKLRRGGNENKDGTSLQTSDQSETWGSHLNKSKTTQEDTNSGPQHRKGSLLSKLSQKLYENYSQSRKVSCRCTVHSFNALIYTAAAIFLTNGLCVVYRI